MARKVQVHLVDDIDGSMADETLKFSLDGLLYEIDLSAANAEGLRKELAKYIVAGRRGPRGLAPDKRRRSTPARPVGYENRNLQIREWAKRSGIELSNRGRIPTTVAAQFQAANA